VTSGYVTTGKLKGYGYTYIGNASNQETCVVPVCGITGCSPSFGASALCAAGVVGADWAYDSLVGVGFNLNQSPTTGDPGVIPAPATITIGALFAGATSGSEYVRVQLVDGQGTAYCVEANAWAPGVPIDISSFNTRCWDVSGEGLFEGTPIGELHLIVPSDALSDRPFAFCLLDVTF
jgi:hypothetical protein